MNNAGWYKNPENNLQERFWDGHNWTDETGQRVSIVSIQGGYGTQISAEIERMNNNIAAIRWTVTAFCFIILFVILFIGVPVRMS